MKCRCARRFERKLATKKPGKTACLCASPKTRKKCGCGFCWLSLEFHADACGINLGTVH